MPTYTALINPVSGGGRALRTWRPIAELLASQGIRIAEQTTRSQQHATEAAAESARRGETVIAVGGDGLARDVAAGVHGTGASMAIVPAGRGNDFARKLELPGDVESLAAMLARRGTRSIDVIEAAGRIVLGNVYVGLDSVATEAINNNRWLPGLVVYRLAPIGVILKWRAPEFTLTADTWTAKARQHQVVAANSGRYGYGLNIVPPARLDSGVLDVLTVSDAPRYKVVQFIGKARTGAHVESDKVEVRSTKQITIDADRPVPVHADGDYLCELPVTVSIRPAALDIIVP
ncbi:YegS/Rv2252/BmrU family lipid kinase [Spinactinospora alkalitolerans]|uniref:YegS/Rv2252/BmrU family lipid kinase n=1 Tax=Spinactinospora alkalitolerans TaxID=687207 RepID=A0A852TZI4_9ACTN|nr:diacylglycerol kinase family protein [Spinactinospora alkalitolerans]NYE48462.1 YegS/Rv2252/BmrU family lipid kinase [Spinactinospora alkalitolerans]